METTLAVDRKIIAADKESYLVQVKPQIVPRENPCVQALAGDMPSRYWNPEPNNLEWLNGYILLEEVSRCKC